MRRLGGGARHPVELPRKTAACGPGGPVFGFTCYTPWGTATSVVHNLNILLTLLQNAPRARAPARPFDMLQTTCAVKAV